MKLTNEEKKEIVEAVKEEKGERNHGLPLEGVKHLNQAKKMNKAKFMELLIKYLDMSLSELKVAKSNKKTPALDRIVIAVILQAISRGDYKRLDFLMDRIIGKSEQKMDITTAGKTINTSPIDVSKLSDEQLANLKGIMLACNQSNTNSPQ